MEEEEFKDTEIGRIPKEWEIKTLKDIYTVKYGKSHKKSNNGEIPVIGSSGIYSYTDIYLAKSDVIIIGRKGNAGKVYFIDKNCWPSDTTFYIEPITLLISKFTYYYLYNLSISGNDAKTTLPSLQKGTVESIILIIPPLEEQKRITYVLSKIENAIKIQDRIINSLQELKKLMMHKLFAEGIGHTEFKDTEIGRIPKEWEFKTIEEISYKIKAGGTPGRKELKYWNGEIPFVTISDITNFRIYIYKTKEKISELGLKNSSAWLVPPNSLLVSMYATIGETAINKIEVATNQAILAIIPKPCFNVEFGAYVIKYYRKFLYNKNIQSTQKNVNKAILKNFKIPLPPLKEQKRIVDILSTIDNKILIEEDRKKYFEALFKTMLNKLMTGQIRVKNLEMKEND